MALFFNAVTSAFGTTVTSLSYSHTASGNIRLAITSISWANETVTGMTYGGVNETFIGSVTNTPAPPFANCSAHLYYLINPPPTTQTVAVTASGVTHIESGTMSFTGADQSSPIRGFATSLTNSVVVASVPGDIVLDCYSGVASGGSAGLGTPGGGQALQHQHVSSGSTVGGGSTKSGSSPDVTMSWTNTSVTSWALIACSVKPFSGTVLDRSLQLPLTADFCESSKHKLSTVWTSQEGPKKACWKEDN